MLLPNQFGVYEQSSGVVFPEITSQSEYSTLTSLFDIVNGSSGYATGISLLQKKSIKTDWAFWFVRNQLIDSISFYLRSLKDQKFNDVKAQYKIISALAYKTLKSSWFTSELEKRNLAISKEILEALEETYREILKLEKLA